MKRKTKGTETPPGRPGFERIQSGQGTGDHSMIEITTLSGQQIDIAEDSIALVTGPYPNDVGPHTYVYGPTMGALITGEAPQLLISRLQNKETFAVLKRPNGTPAWIHASSVTAVRAPVWTEAPYPGQGVVNAVVIVGKFHQSVQEQVALVIEILNAHSAKL